MDFFFLLPPSEKKNKTIISHDQLPSCKWTSSPPKMPHLHAESRSHCLIFPFLIGKSLVKHSAVQPVSPQCSAVQCTGMHEISGEKSAYACCKESDQMQTQLAEAAAVGRVMLTLRFYQAQQLTELMEEEGEGWGGAGRRPGRRE